MAATHPLPRSFRTAKHPPAYPILPWHRTQDALEIDTDVLGTAFFISGDGGIFVTAGHVVERYADNRRVLRVLHVDDPPTRFLELHVIALQVHPEFDIAVGRVHLPPELFVQHLILAEGELPSGAAVAVFGYAGTKAEELDPDEDEAFPGLHLSVDPRFYVGTVDAFHPSGFGLAKGPVYVHTGETTGGISGGPLMSLQDNGVYGVTSTGSIAYGTATDIKVILDWPLHFMDGATIRDLARASSTTTP